jgi:hypothetical protein
MPGSPDRHQLERGRDALSGGSLVLGILAHGPLNVRRAFRGHRRPVRHLDPKETVLNGVLRFAFRVSSFLLRQPHAKIVVLGPSRPWKWRQDNEGVDIRGEVLDWQVKH